MWIYVFLEKNIWVLGKLWELWTQKAMIFDDSRWVNSRSVTSSVGHRENLDRKQRCKQLLGKLLAKLLSSVFFCLRVVFLHVFFLS